ncbi:hypothetical protein Smp_166130 [Schistosoma mansoni]|uniref:hypothetical protein n=1 Tax=Schistosoma mansoni TaxID=6183 RepID=UPI00019B379A|nr:hypothetical protein Smp_166130 [Schistosoma mansoni]|eukprot:XP_018645420.1 hypothetical protein Smp_166130 [Schistosoma mansoni]
MQRRRQISITYLTFPECPFSHSRPLSNIQTFTYIFTTVKRFIKLDLACSLKNTSTEYMASVFLHRLLSNYSVPLSITAYHGRQIQPFLFRKFTKLLNAHHVKITAYHVVAFGMKKSVQPLKISVHHSN